MNYVTKSDVKLIKTLENYLKTHFYDCPIIPISNQTNSKAPAYAHKNVETSELWLMWDQFKKKHGDVSNGIGLCLRKDLIVIDIDDKNLCDDFERRYPEFTQTATQETRKGKHYFFKRTDKCNLLEIYDSPRGIVENNQALPLDIKTVCKNGTGGIIVLYPAKNKKWIKPIWNFDPLPSIPDEFIDYIYKHNTHAQGGQKDKNNKPASNPKTHEKTNIQETQFTNQNKEEYEDICALVNLLDNKRAEDYSGWISLGWCLYNISHGSPYEPQIFNLWDEFSKKCPAKYTPGMCKDLWVKFEQKNLGIRSLHHWAKQDSPLLYHDLMKNHLSRLLFTCDGTECMVAKIAQNISNESFVRDGEWFYFDGKRWSVDLETSQLRTFLSETVHNRIVKEAYFLQQKDKKHIAIAKKLKKIAKDLRSCKYKNSIVKELMDMNVNPFFQESLDTNPNLIAFENGVWELKEHRFRSCKKEDMISSSTHYDYIEPNESHKNIVYDYLSKLHPVKETRDYIIKMFARQLYGDDARGFFHMHAGQFGSAQNGKSSFFEILRNILGDYAQSFPVSFVTQDRFDAQKPNPELHSWKGVRILYCSEPNANEKINSGTLKNLTGGDTLSYRNIWCKRIRQLTPMFKLHLMCNDTPRISGNDEGVKRRVRKIDYKSKFVDRQSVDETKYLFQSNPELILKMKTDVHLKNAFIQILFDHFDYDFDFHINEEMLSCTNDYLQENNPFALFINDYIQQEEGTFTTFKEIKETFKKSEYNYSDFIPKREDCEKYLKVESRNFKKIKGIKYTWVFENFKISPPGLSSHQTSDHKENNDQNEITN